MSSMSNYIQKLEMYGDLEVSIIRTTKINKVLKAIIKLNSIPRDEEFDFRGRSINILGKWKNLLDSDLPASGSGATVTERNGKNARGVLTANGVLKQRANGNGKAEEATEGDEEGAVPADDVPMPDASEMKNRVPEAVVEKSGTPAGGKEAEGVAS